MSCHSFLDSHKYTHDFKYNTARRIYIRLKSLIKKRDINNVIENTTRNHLSVNVTENLTTSITTYQGKKKIIRIVTDEDTNILYKY